MEWFSGFEVSESDSDRHCGTLRNELLPHHKNPVVDSKYHNTGSHDLKPTFLGKCQKPLHFFMVNPLQLYHQYNLKLGNTTGTHPMTACMTSFPFRSGAAHYNLMAFFRFYAFYIHRKSPLLIGLWF
jgi:hypothetical protein